MKTTNEDAIRKMLGEKYSLNTQAIDEIIKIAYDKLEVFTSQNASEEDLAKKFEIIVTSMLIKRTNSNAKEYKGVFLLDGGAVMKNENKIKKILKTFEEDPLAREQLLAEGTVKIIDGKPTVCDNKESYDGKPNKKFGKPLKVEQQRQLTGFVEINEERKDALLILKGDAITEKIPLCQLIEFKGIAFGDNPVRIFLESDTVKPTGESVEIEALLPEVFGEPKTVKEAEEYLDNCMKEDIFSQPVLIKGIIERYNTSNPEALSIIVRDNVSLDSIGEKVPQIFVKITDKFDGEVYSECLIAGLLWKVGNEGNQLFGMSAMVFLCNSKRVIAEELSENDLDL